MTSSPLRPGASLTDELDYYKKQYEQLETDLADFQASSKELEEQLERDIETSEKNERKLREQVEKLGFEVEEWKTKHKQAKAEANSAQNTLQKEITTIRESNRAMQLKLRDIEVVNDDYERQARNTESSMEDLESKYNVAIERSVLLDEEMRIGDQEREGLRIETQRLRDELGDLRVESDITQEKLVLANSTIERLRLNKPSPMAVENLRSRSPGSEASGATPSSPTASTPPPKSDTGSEMPTPPSPPLSDAPMNGRFDAKTPIRPNRQSLFVEPSATPRAPLHGSRVMPKHGRGPSLATSSTATSDTKSMLPPSAAKPRMSSRPSIMPERLPKSDSLYQIKQLRGRMQKIEERVHSARSKLPAPSNTTPRGSPRTASAMGEHLSSSVTIRRQSRQVGSLASSMTGESTDNSDAEAKRKERQLKRISIGIPRPSSAMGPRNDPERPPSAMERPPSRFDRPPSSASRPSSRASMASAPPRPGSRAGAHSAAPPSASRTALPSRPRSSIGGTDYGSLHLPPTRRTHRPSASVSELRRMAMETDDPQTSPTRRKTMEKAGLLPNGRRTTLGVAKDGPPGDMRPPPSRRKVDDVGETY